ncbi:MAG: SemiSWEET transporter [Methylophilaceae bacterium]|jgi:MtN3 and saliva related transmembrane protein|nr:SemiSWEET transporter [Methylophilaceae bacterium]|tara:strand:+ start:10801 stop:11064 length:264 start_codon:yes stop_codon:yes gene_type:complete
MIFVDYVGSIAATCTTLAFIPQAIHSYKTRDLSGISLPMYSIFTAGVAMWLVYGLLKQDWPIIIANTITVALSAMMLVLKIMGTLKK